MGTLQVQWSAAHEEDNSRRKACLKRSIPAKMSVQMPSIYLFNLNIN